MNRERVIVTSTRYESAATVRCELCLQTIAVAQAAEIPLIVVDHSPPEVRELFRGNGVTIITGEGTMGERRRAGFALALEHGATKIAWIEPEKCGMIPWLSLLFLLLDDADLVIPGRTQRGWDSYPVRQVESEQKCNHDIAEILGLDTPLDVMFGPRVMNARATAIFAEPEHHQFGLDTWGATFTPLVAAMAAGLSIVGQHVGFTYPFMQRREEENDPVMLKKREKQAAELVAVMQSAAKSYLGVTAAVAAD